MKIDYDTLYKIRRLHLPKLIHDRALSVTQRSPTSYSMRCPFHDDKTPSLHITQKPSGCWLWHCFGCNAKGGVVDFIMRLDNISFPEVYEKLSKLNGEYVSETTAGREQGAENNVNPYELLKRVTDIYHESLLKNKHGQEYLQKRGLLDNSIIKDFKIGYCDAALKKTLAKDGPIVDELRAIGILNDNNNEVFYNSITFPIFDEEDNIVSLYARKLTSGHLHLKGPHKGVFNYKAAVAFKDIILTESIIDSLSAYKLGITNAIPLYGTYGLSSDHIELFKRERTDKITILFDNDKAGEDGATAISERLSHSLNIPIYKATLPEDTKDINDYLIKGATSADLKSIISNANLIQQPNEKPTDIKVNIEDEILYITIGTRPYRIRGWKSPFLSSLRVNIKLQLDNTFHIDAIDLYSQRARGLFSNRCSRIFNIDKDIIEADLLTIINQIEAQQTSLTEDKEPKSNPIEISPEDKEAALEYLKSKNLINNILLDMSSLGYIGEQNNKILGYLVSISRKLDNPLSMIICSCSSAGKSSLAEVIEKLSPSEECLIYSRVTPQALYYMEKDFLKNKLLIIEERSGSYEADYSIRTLQSRQKLTLAVPIKDPSTGKIRTHSFEVEGPISYIETTTQPLKNHENSNRCFEVYLDESREQTKKIQQHQRLLKTKEGLRIKAGHDKIIRLHHNMQRLLKPIKVINPYAGFIEFPSEYLRTRRDNPRFLNLIEAVTLLHQYQRDKVIIEGNEAIESNMDDYKIAYELSKELLNDTLSELKRPQREVFDKIKELSKKDKAFTFTRKTLRDTTGLPDHRIRSILKELEELEYIISVDGSNGRLYRYRINPDISVNEKIIKGLISPDELKRRLTFTTLRNLKTDLTYELIRS